MTASSEDYRGSQNTAIKQRSFRDFVGWHIDICQSIWQRRPNWKNPKYVYIDLHGGPGMDCGKDGSPLIFAKIAQSKGLDYRGLVYEKKPETYNQLAANIAHIPQMIAVMDDHNRIRHSDDLNLYDGSKKWIYGIVYCDPSNAQIPIEPLWTVIEQYPVVEVMINIAAASYKRQKNMPTYQELDSVLRSLKPKWIIRKPVDKFQWTILVGTNLRSFGEWHSRGFYDWDSDVGREWYEKITMTADELRDKYQPGLFDDDD